MLPKLRQGKHYLLRAPLIFGQDMITPQRRGGGMPAGAVAPPRQECCTSSEIHKFSPLLSAARNNSLIPTYLQ